jgi:transcriptional regulator with GAF, ATPase, and Fis domain
VSPETLPAVTLRVAQERQVGAVLERIVEGVAAQEGVALARVWLVEPGDLCDVCHLRTECADRTRCLHLVASAGGSLDGREAWDGLDGAFRRFPLGVRKVGRVGATGTGILLHDMSDRSTWIVRPEWAAREGIRSFAAQPLAFGGAVLGVLAAFSRRRVDATAFTWLRALADHAAAALAHARAIEALAREHARLRAEATRAHGDTELVGASPALAKVAEQIALVAPTDAAVLVTGEPGTGKSLVARRIHAQSRRNERPLVVIDCAAPASEGMADRIAAAAGGTLVLDEVCALPLTVQDAFLNLFLRAPAADVRLIATTSRDPAREIAAGRLRRDVHHRVSVFSLALPPLRERPEDVAPLVAHFLRAVGARLGRADLVVSGRDVRALARAPWLGNVRELAATVQRAALLAHDGHVRFDVPGAPSTADVVPASEWRGRERANVEAALARAGGRIYGTGGAAEILGVPPTTLASRVKALGIVRRPAG